VAIGLGRNALRNKTFEFEWLIIEREQIKSHKANRLEENLIFASDSKYYRKQRSTYKLRITG